MLCTRSGFPVIALAVTFLVHAGCEAPAHTLKPYQYTVPEQINDGWDTASLNREHIDADLVKALLNRVSTHAYPNIHSVLLVRNGKLVVEEYFAGMGADSLYHAYHRDTLHTLQSVTKSVTSILIGIALDQHLIRGVDEKISTFFPEYADIFADRAKANIRLQHCLAMTAGLSWDEWERPFTDPRNDHIMMNNRADPIRYNLERPIAVSPGAKFVYNSGLSLILGQIIDKVSGLKADQFAERYLFAPLGISEYVWWRYPNGTVHTGGGLRLRPRDMAKLGALVLNGGRWHGKQIVSAAWVKASTTQQAPSHTSWFEWWPFTWGYAFLHKAPLIHVEYGYHWWLRSFRVRGRAVATYSAEGRGGQFIVIVPEFQLVAVFTGWNDDTSWDLPLDMLQRYILPAVQ